MSAHSESRNKTLTIGVRATPDEKKKLQSRAAAFGISMGELVRESLFNSMPKSKTDQSAISELAITRADLGRLGGLLKGWLAGTFPQGVPAPQTQPDVVKLLRQIEAAQKQVLEAVSKVSAK
jgi:plasmid stability protein